jgi:GTPase SAR1 family protein
MNYYEAWVFIIVFDVTSIRSFNNAKEWRERVQKFKDTEDVAMVLVG